MELTEPGITHARRNSATQTPEPWMPVFEVTPIPIDSLCKPIQRCIERIRHLLASEIDGATVQVICERPGDRVNLALTIDDKPIAFNFITEDECMRAYERDPAECASIDHFTRNWITVARVKMKDNRSITEFSHQALAMVAQARAARMRQPA